MWKKEKSETTAPDLTNKIITGIHIKESESENTDGKRKLDILIKESES